MEREAFFVDLLSDATNGKGFCINTCIRFFNDIRITFQIENLDIDSGICIIQCPICQMFFS